MTHTRLAFSGLMLLTAAAFASAEAYACRYLRAVNQSEKDQANVVFVGTPKHYSVSKDGHSATVTYSVSKTLRGEKRSQWHVSIKSNTNWTIPGSFEEFKNCWGTQTEVGIMLPASKNGTAVAVQDVCNPPYLAALTTRGMNCIP